MEMLITLGGFIALFIAITGLRRSIEQIAFALRAIDARLDAASFAAPPPPPEAAEVEPMPVCATAASTRDRCQRDRSEPVPEPAKPAPVDRPWHMGRAGSRD